MKNRGFFIFVVLVLVTFGLLAFNSLFATKDKNFDRKGIVACADPDLPVPTELHLHPQLQIIIDGQSVAIPGDIGISEKCHRALHTHDPDGIIHVEPNHPGDFKLKDFFFVWGQEFNQNQILDKEIDATHRIIFTVNGVQNNEFENVVLKDKQLIRIEYVRTQ